MILTKGAAFPDAAPPPPPLLDLAPHGVGLRRATAFDLLAFADLYARQRALEMVALGWPEAARRAFLAEQFDLQHAHFTRHHPKADFWAVTRESDLSASVIGRFYVDRSVAPWSLIEIGLEPALQGRGLGSALIGWLQRSAPKAGVELHVALDNPRAAALYQRLGFADIVSSAPTHRRMLWRP